MVKGLLDSEGIDSVMITLDIPQDVIPVGGVVIRVRPDQADEARRAIKESLNTSAEDLDQEASAETDPTA